MKKVLDFILSFVVPKKIKRYRNSALNRAIYYNIFLNS